MDKVEINFGDKTFFVPSDQSLLDSLQMAGASIPSSCKAGVCQSCLMQSEGSPPPPGAQKDLAIEKKAQGYFLACQCFPVESMTVRRADDAIPRHRAVVLGTYDLSDDVKLVRFARPSAFNFYAGQFVNLHSDCGIVRSYSLASLPGNNEHIDIHVRRVPHGAMSDLIFNRLKIGDSFRMSAPKGDCCFVDGIDDKPMLLVGVGTGIAPLQAIAREAMLSGKKNSIYFYQGASNDTRLYLRDDLRGLASVHQQFNYLEVTLAGKTGKYSRNGHIVDIVLQDIDSMKLCNAFLCGDAAIVGQLRKALFIAGIPMKRIRADAFVAAKPSVSMDI